MSKKLTIVHVVHSLEVGGLENGLVNLVNQLPPEHFDHVICCLSRSGALAARIERRNVTIHEMGLDMTRFRFPLMRLAHLFRRVKPDIVHTRGWSAVDAVFAAKLAWVPHVIHGEHGRDAADPQGKNFKHNAIRRTFSPLVDCFITVSDDLRNWLVGTVGLSQKKVVTIHNGVDTEKFAPVWDNGLRAWGKVPGADSGEQLAADNGSAVGPLTLALRTPHSVLDSTSSVVGRRSSRLAALRHTLGLPEGALVIGTVGRLDPVKDHRSLLLAFAAVARIERLAQLVIVGDGPMRAELEKLIKELKIDDSVTMMGEIQEVSEVLKAFDVFTLTSIAEGISNTILEAMATGLPIVATRVGGNPELVQHDTTGQLIPAEDVSGLSEALLTYARNVRLRMSHGAAARQRAVDKFSLEQMAYSYECRYREVARQRSHDHVLPHDRGA